MKAGIKNKHKGYIMIKNDLNVMAAIGIAIISAKVKILHAYARIFVTISFFSKNLINGVPIK